MTQNLTITCWMPHIAGGYLVICIDSKGQEFPVRTHAHPSEFFAVEVVSQYPVRPK